MKSIVFFLTTYMMEVIASNQFQTAVSSVVVE